MVCSGEFWYDSRLRCDIADLYFELYGRKKPVCIPLPELAAMRPKKVEKEKPGSSSEVCLCFSFIRKVDFNVRFLLQKSFVIPKAEKRKAVAEEKPSPSVPSEPPSKKVRNTSIL